MKCCCCFLSTQRQQLLEIARGSEQVVDEIVGEEIDEFEITRREFVVDELRRERREREHRRSGRHGRG